MRSLNWRDPGHRCSGRAAADPRRASRRARARCGHRSPDEQGAMLVLATFAIIMLLMVAGVAIDLGTAYAGGRQMQNAADAAAFAGASELECVLFSPNADPPGVGCQTMPANPSDVYTVVTSVAAENGATGSLTCEMEYYDSSTGGYTHSQAEQCDNPYGTSGWYANTAVATTPNAPNYSNLAGVYVEVGTSQGTFFGGITGTTSTAEHRQAAAAIEQIAGSSLGSAFFACASAATTDLLSPEPSSASGEPGFLQLGTPPPGIVIDTDMQYNGANPAGYLVNPAALYSPSTQTGPVYNIWGPSGTATCGLRSHASKGLVHLTTPLPNTERIKPGVTAGQIYNPVLVASGCTGKERNAQVGCRLVVPVCVGSNQANGANGVLWCVGFGEFEYLSGSKNSATFGFLGLAANATAGPTSSGPPSPSGINVVRLVE